MKALTVENLSVSYGSKKVLDQVNIHVNYGELAALLGPNGAGKTTLLRAILGLIPASNGRIEIGGATAKNPKIGYVPQRHEFAWDFPLDVAGVVMSGRTRQIGWLRRPKRADWEAVYAALDRVGMVSRAKEPIGALSGGQRQRVLIARALSTQPQVLLLDEPFTGLDQPSTETLMEIFGRLAGEGQGLLMSTHDLVGALAAVDRVILIRGQVWACGCPANISSSAWANAFQVGVDSPLLRVVEAFRVPANPANSTNSTNPASSVVGARVGVA